MLVQTHQGMTMPVPAPSHLRLQGTAHHFRMSVSHRRARLGMTCRAFPLLKGVRAPLGNVSSPVHKAPASRRSDQIDAQAPSAYSLSVNTHSHQKNQAHPTRLEGA